LTTFIDFVAFKSVVGAEVEVYTIAACAGDGVVGEGVVVGAGEEVCTIAT
jgi:hypothetical protein